MVNIYDLECKDIITGSKDLTELTSQETNNVFGGASAESAILQGAKRAVGGALVGAAFGAGYWLGSELDNHYKWSDRISDWASENFPWPL
ncbi:MAG: hypothetical protein QNJ33_20665 [Crocosphaera sp.]|nr:hypothetical protein [Crocosphaera sp.]